MHCLQGEETLASRVSCMIRAWLGHAHTGSPATLNCHVARLTVSSSWHAIVLCLTTPHLQT